MKIYPAILLFFIAGLLNLHPAAAQFTETKEVSRRFRVQPETRIEISNKYGKIILNPWDKDSVVVKINLRVENKKLSKLEKQLEEINFDFTNTSNFLIIRTRFTESASPLERELMRVRETLLQSDGSTEINYEVWLPRKNNLRVENKFGDILIGKYAGETDITLSNGKMKASELTGRTRLNLNFADVSADQITNAQVTSNYSELYLKTAQKMRISSKSSTFEIIEIDDLETNSRRDKFRIRRAGEIDATGSFSSFRLTELLQKINLRADFGNLDIEKILPGFSSIYIETKSTDVNLAFDPACNFAFDITHTKTEVDLSREVEVTDKQTIDAREGKNRLTGFFGNKKENKEKVLINTSLGELNIRSY